MENAINLLDDGQPTPPKASGNKSNKKSSTKSRHKPSKSKQQQQHNLNARSSNINQSVNPNTTTAAATHNRNIGHTQRRTSAANAVGQNGNLNDSKKSVSSNSSSGSYIQHQQQQQSEGKHNDIHNSSTTSSSSKGHTKNFICLEPRSVKIFWEQHDHSEVELTPSVCARVAEDTSYKLWELMNTLKTYIRHSGGVATYDLVNEIFRCKDIPAALGALENDYDRIDYDSSFYFYLDNIIELRDEFQKSMTVTLPDGPDYECNWPVTREAAPALKQYIVTLLSVIFNGNASAVREALNDFAFSTFIASSYRPLLTKFIGMLAFKQSDERSAKCWRCLRALSINPHVVTVACPAEYYHLSEILCCQLLGPCESIKRQKMEDTQIQMEIDNHHHLDIKIEPLGGDIQTNQNNHFNHLQQQQQLQYELFHESINNSNIHSHIPNPSINLNTHYEFEEEKIHKIVKDDNDEENNNELPEITSPYNASPVDEKYVNDLCETLGHLGAISGHFQTECLFNITRRLRAYFDEREIKTSKDFQFISRAVRGLTALGEFAYREFIPFIYEFKANDVPEIMWNEFALGAVFLKGADDIFLYEWLECVCGADKLQPFLGYSSNYYQKLESLCFLMRKLPKFKYLPVMGVRRLEWNTSAVMCDDSNNAIKTKPRLADVFPHLKCPNLERNRPGTIRFKFAGCRPVLIKPKESTSVNNGKNGSINTANIKQTDILIATRKLLKPLTDDKRLRHLSSYQSLRI